MGRSDGHDQMCRRFDVGPHREHSAPQRSYGHASWDPYEGLSGGYLREGKILLDEIATCFDDSVQIPPNPCGWLTCGGVEMEPQFQVATQVSGELIDMVDGRILQQLVWQWML